MVTSSNDNYSVMDSWILLKMLINVFSVTLHALVLLTIFCTKSLHSHSFDAVG